MHSEAPRTSAAPSLDWTAGPPRQRSGGHLSRSARKHRKKRVRLAWIIVATLAGLALLATAALTVPGSPLARARAGTRSAGAPGASATAPTSTPTSTTVPRATPTPTTSPTPFLPPLQLHAAALTVATEGFFSWALLDRRTGEIWGSPNIDQTTWPASMIKPWLASDDLRRLAEADQKPSASRLRDLERMIRDSDNNAAQAAYVRNGRTASIKRLISRCKLVDTEASSKGWSFTTISARDTVLMADCIADGTAAGPQWTEWVLTMMRTVRVGDWGIRKGLPLDSASQVAIKNGWLFYDDDRSWHINCMAVTPTWALSVLQRYRGHGRYDSDFAFGRTVCQQVTEQMLNPDYAGSG